MTLYEALANLELRDGRDDKRFDKAVDALELGLKSLPNEGRLRLMLATLLARRGATDTLLVQINQLENMGYSPLLLQYLRARYYVNSRQYAQARQMLVPL